MNVNLKSVFSILTFGDKVLIGVIILLSLASMGLVYRPSAGGEIAVVESASQDPIRLNLSSDDTVSVAGVVGSLVVEVSQGAIRIMASRCPQQLCVRQSAINKIGDIIVCVPNKVTIWIEGEKSKHKFDAITG